MKKIKFYVSIIIPVLFCSFMLCLNNNVNAASKEPTLDVSEAPTMSTKINTKEYDDVILVISSKNGLNKKRIGFYTVNEETNKYETKISENDLLAKDPEQVVDTKTNKIIRYTYRISNEKYLKQKDHKFFVAIKDDIGNFYYCYLRIYIKDKRYSLDAAPRAKDWKIEYTDLTFIVEDKSGISAVNVYDMNSSDISKKLPIEKTKISKSQTKITVDIPSLKKDKDGNYKIKIYTRDNQKNVKQRATRLMKFSVQNMQVKQYSFGNDSEMYYCYENNNKSKKVTGFVKMDGKTYYFTPKQTKYSSKRKGEQVTAKKYEQLIGWVKVGNDFYFFNTEYGKKGYMVKNKMVDGINLGSDGKAELQSKSGSNKYSLEYGTRKLKTLVRASDLVNAITTPSMSKETKLKKCWDYLIDSHEIPYSTFPMSIHIPFGTEDARGWDYEYAQYPLFTDGYSDKWWTNGINRGANGGEVGCCYCKSAAFAYLANAIGYNDAKVVSNGDGTSHARAEIGNKTYDMVRDNPIYGGTYLQPGVCIKNIDDNNMYYR